MGAAAPRQDRMTPERQRAACHCSSIIAADTGQPSGTFYGTRPSLTSALISASGVDAGLRGLTQRQRQLLQAIISLTSAAPKC